MVAIAIWAVWLVLPAAGADFNQGQRPDSLFSGDYLHLLVTDTTGKSIVSFRARHAGVRGRVGHR